MIHKWEKKNIESMSWELLISDEHEHDKGWTLVKRKHNKYENDMEVPWSIDDLSSVEDEETIESTEQENMKDQTLTLHPTMKDLKWESLNTLTDAQIDHENCTSESKMTLDMYEEMGDNNEEEAEDIENGDAFSTPFESVKSAFVTTMESIEQMKMDNQLRQAKNRG